MKFNRTGSTCRWFAKLILVVLIAGSCQSRENKISQIIKSYREKSVFNGYLHISYEGDTLYEGVVGNKFDQIEKPEIDDPVYLASLTKLFTKLTILRLAQEGKLRLDQTIGEIRPSFQPKFGKEVTVRHLLEMKAGLPREPDEGQSLGMVTFDDKNQAGQGLDTIPEIVLSGTPGETESYSNLSYWLLGAIIEEVTGGNLDKAFGNLLFDPLEMEHSGLSVAGLEPIPSYSLKGDSRERDLTNYSGRYASGGAYSSVEDLMRLAEYLKLEFDDSEGILFGKKNRLEYYGSLPNASNIFVLDREAGFCFIFLNNAGIADLSEISNLLKEVQNELGIEALPSQKRTVQVDAMSTLNDSIPIESAMLDWSKAIEEGDEKSIFETLNYVAEEGAFNADEPTWGELANLSTQFPGWKALGYRFVKEVPAGYEIWFKGETEEKMAIRWISSKVDSNRVNTIFIQPDDMEWMGIDY